MSTERLAQSETYYPGYQEAHSGVTGVAFGIRRVADGQWYDFNDSTFKASGWTTKQQALAEGDDGLWTYDTGWAIPDADAVYHLQWKITDATGTFYELGPKIIVNDIYMFTVAKVNTEVDNALNTAIPATPTGDSINDYIQRIKCTVVNKQEITEANGNTIIYKDDDTTSQATVVGAYTSDSTTTVRKRLE